MLSNLILGVGHEKVIICRRNVSEALEHLQRAQQIAIFSYFAEPSKKTRL